MTTEQTLRAQITELQTVLDQQVACVADLAPRHIGRTVSIDNGPTGKLRAMSVTSQQTGPHPQANLAHEHGALRYGPGPHAAITLTVDGWVCADLYPKTRCAVITEE